MTWILMGITYTELFQLVIEDLEVIKAVEISVL